MTDPTLRMPDTVFRAVLDLGELPLDAPPLPPHLANPTIGADFDWEDESGHVQVEFDDCVLHLDLHDPEDGVQYHFHDADDEDRSPWSDADTTAVLHWAVHFGAHVLQILPTLASDAEDAADWYHDGLTVYAGEYEQTQLQIVEVVMEGELMMLPWLGSGHVGHEHIDEVGGIALTWNPEHDDPDRPIAVAFLSPETGAPVSAPMADVDWDEVGLPAAEVQTWLETLYLNHMIVDPADVIMRAALRKIAGFDA